MIDLEQTATRQVGPLRQPDRRILEYAVSQQASDIHILAADPFNVVADHGVGR